MRFPFKKKSDKYAESDVSEQLSEIRRNASAPVVARPIGSLSTFAQHPRWPMGEAGGELIETAEPAGEALAEIKEVKRELNDQKLIVDRVASDMKKLKAEYEPTDFRGLLQNSPKWIQMLYFPARTALAVSIAGIILSFSGGHAAETLEWESLSRLGQAAGGIFLGTSIATALLSWITRPRKQQF